MNATPQTPTSTQKHGRCPFGHDAPTPDWDPMQHAGGAPIIAELARLREEAPVAWTDAANGGYWTVTRYDDITAAARDTKRFSNVPRHPRIGTVFTPPLEADRPTHTSFRRLLNQFFTREYLAEHTAWLEGLADAFIDRLIAQDVAADSGDGEHADWVGELCMPLPATVLCRLIGMPDDDWRLIRSWTETSFLSHRDRGNDPEKFAEVNEHLNAYGSALIERARQEPDRDDIVSTLLKDPIADGLDDSAVFGLVRLLLQAGHSTTAMGMSNVMHRLATDTEVQLFARDNPGRLEDLVREILREDTPVLANVRRVTEDLDFGGRQICKDDHVLLAWGSGNNDPGRIENPGQIIPDRPVTDSLTFGHGIHKCPGMPLAVREIAVVVARLLERTDSFVLRGQAQRKRWEGNGVVSMGLSVS